MSSMLSSIGSIALWTLPLLPAEDIYEAFKMQKNRIAGSPFGNHYEKNLEAKVHAEMGDFLKKHRIRKDLKIFEMSNDGICTAVGSNSFSKESAIVCCPGLDQIDGHAFRWVFKHEISHLKNNDLLSIAIVRTVSFIASVAFFHLGMGLLPFTAAILTFGVSVVCTKLFRNYVENRADSFANHHATTEELKGGLRILHALMETDQGTFSLFHPSTDSRIKNVEKELIQRKTVYVIEQEKITKLRELIKKI